MDQMHIENVKPGQWIIVLGKKPIPVSELEPNNGDVLQLFADKQIPMHCYEPDGIPVKVKAISPPFIATEHLAIPPVLRIIDTSRYTITKATPQYVKAFKDNFQQHMEHRSAGPSFLTFNYKTPPES